MTKENKIKANELRIGNLVFAETGLPSLEVHIIQPHDIYDIDNGVVAFGISLTEEWLMRLGFGQRYTSDPQETRASQCFFICDFILHNTPDDNYLGFYFYSHDGLMSNIQYVHQLQNLYYSLTGRELEFILTKIY